MVVMLDYSLAPTGKTLLEMPQIGEALKQGMLDGQRILRRFAMRRFS